MDKHEPRRFFKDTLVVAVTQGLVKLRGLIAVPLFVKLLGTAAFGVWSQIVALATLLGVLVTFNLHLPLVRSIAADRSKMAATWTSIVLPTLGVALAATIVVVVAATPIASMLLDGEDASTALRVGAWLIVLTCMRSLNMNLLRAVGSIRQRSIFELALSVGEIPIIVLVLLLGGRIVGVFLAVSLWETVIVGIQTVYCFRLAGWARPSLDIFKTSLRFSLPAVPASLSAWILDRVDRFVIGNVLGAHEVGVYSAVYAVASLVLVFQVPLQITLFPKVSGLWATRRDEAKRYIEVSCEVFLALALPAAAALFWVAEPILQKLGNAEIAGGAGPLAGVVSLGVVMWGVGMMQMQALLAGGRSVAVAVVTAAGAALNLVLNVLLVPLVGTMGAGWATLASYLLTCLLLHRASAGDDQIRIWSRTSTRTVFATGLMGAFLEITSSAHVMVWIEIPTGAAVYLFSQWLLERALVAQNDDSQPGLWRSTRTLLSSARATRATR